MATCPVCQSGIELTAQHYGTLFTCPRCSAVFFVDWSGQPEIAALEEDLPADPVNYKAAEFPAEEAPPFEPFPPQDLEPPVQPSFEPPVQPSFEPPVQPEFNTQVQQDLETAEQTDSAVDYRPLQPEPPSDSPSFLDVSDFGNSETAHAAFNYTLKIDGVDSSSVRIALKEALSDSKFAWDVNEILAQIKDGSLTIRSVSAIKAGILVQRIKYLPVKISWRQDVLSGSV